MNGPNLKDFRDKNPNPHLWFKSNESALSSGTEFYDSPSFHQALCRERKRAKRSKRPFLLILLHIGDPLLRFENQGFVKRIEETLSSCVRETDIKGWYQQDKIISIIFTEIATVDEIIKEKILLKIQKKLLDAFGREVVQTIRLAHYILPENHPGNTVEWFPWTHSQELMEKNHFERFLLVKKAISFVGGFLRLVPRSPYSSLVRPKHQAGLKNTGFIQTGK